MIDYCEDFLITNRMIIIQLSGGLGNQMFQYALYASMLEMGKDVRIDVSSLEKLKIHNGFELDYVFGLIPNFANNEEVKKLRTSDNGLITRISNKTGLTKSTHFKYSALDFTPKVFSLKEDVYMQGYWQSEKYFINICDKINRLFSFEETVLSNRNKEFAKYLLSKNSVSIHVRRGDYLHSSLYQGICSEDYYSKAVTQMDSMIEEAFYFIFSDDIGWCKRYFKGDRFIFIDWNHANRDNFSDMFLMSCCKNHIIANSSFSWWGAWLAKNDEKAVMAPSKWINKVTCNINDILPEKWLRLDP